MNRIDKKHWSNILYNKLSLLFDYKYLFYLYEIKQKRLWPEISLNGLTMIFGPIFYGRLNKRAGAS